MASYAASRSSSTALQVGAASSRSSPVSRSETKAPIHASSSPILTSATLACSTKTRPGGKSHQVLEDTSGGRPNIVLEGDRQPAPVVPARRGLLAHVGPARFNAQTFDVARRAIRHLAPAADQGRGPRR